MKVRAFAMDGQLARTAQSSIDPDGLEYANGILCEGDVSIKQAYIKQGTMKEHYRPYLVLDGEVTGIRGDFPNNVSEVHFSDEHRRVDVSYQYQFSNEELASMCQKGLFDDGFEVPQIMTDNNGFQLPMVCDCFAVNASEIPILFVKVQSQYNMEIESKTCGYTLGDYFEQAVVKEDEFLEDEDMQSMDFDEEDSLFEANKQEEPAPEVVESEEDKTLSSEDMLIHKAFENIEHRVEHKVLQAKQSVSETAKADNVNPEPSAKADGQDEVTESAEPMEFADTDFVEDDSPFTESVEVEDVPEEEPEQESDETEDAVTDSEEKSEQEKKKSSAAATAISDIKEAVVDEKRREIPASISDIDKQNDALEDEGAYF